MTHNSTLCGWLTSHFRRHSPVLGSSDRDWQMPHQVPVAANQWKASGGPVLKAGTTDPIA